MLDTDDKMLDKAKGDGRNQVMFAAEVQATKTIHMHVIFKELSIIFCFLWLSLFEEHLYMVHFF